MNIAEIMKLKGAWDTFSANHPQFVKFLEYMASSPVEEGTVFALTVRRPESQKEIKTNLQISESDLEMIRTLKALAEKK